MRTLIIIALFFLIAGVALSAQKECNHCGQSIRGKSILVEGKHYHPEHFTCAYCGDEIGIERYFKKERKYYHSGCYNNLYGINCDYCGELISEEYIMQEGQNYHSSCFERNVAERCDLCRGILQGDYFIDLYGYAYHKYHTEDAYSCEYCSGFFLTGYGKGGIELEDGRLICEHCFGSSLLDIDSLKSLTEEVNQHMRRYELDVPLEEISFHLVSRDQLLEFYNASDLHTLGYTRYQLTERLFGLMTDEKLDIYILYGVPRLLAIKIIAHELNHAWQYMENHLTKDPQYCEGSCNYAAFLALGAYSEPLAEQMREAMSRDKDKIYGDGFRKVKALVERTSLEHWREHLAENQQPPDNF